MGEIRRRVERKTERQFRRVLKEQEAEPTSIAPRYLTQDQRNQTARTVLRCAAKLAFRSRAAVVKWIRSHPPSAHRQHKVEPYECPQCGQWHTTKVKA